ncbi:MAG: hypothetical protein GY816_22420 [Cytophagales bacterium]|nr:hypothetical protein [Cytophagales bacterium]
MKKFMKNFAFPIVLITAIIFQACNKDPVYDEITWKASTSLSIEAGDPVSFVLLMTADEVPVPSEMSVDELTIGLNLDWEEKDKGAENPISKVTFYVQMEEIIDGVQNTYGYDSELELGSVDDFSDIENVTFTFNSTDVYALFESSFDGSRDQYDVKARPGDSFVIWWKITGNDGSILSVDCFGPGCQYGFGVDAKSDVFNWWDGTFDYEWIDASDDVMYWDDYYGGPAVEIGGTGTITFAATENAGETYVSQSMFNYYFSANDDATALINHDEYTGLFEIEGDMGIEWTISNIDGSSLDIWWTYDTSYDDWAEVTLTRQDGKDWPTNMYQYAGTAPEGSVWNGTFNYEWLVASSGVQTWDDYYEGPEIEAGFTGSMDITTTGAGTSEVEHGWFGYYYGEVLANLTFDYSSGLMSVAPGSDNLTWEIINVEDRAIDIEWSIDTDYDEGGTVRLFRTDNYHWPENTHSN